MVHNFQEGGYGFRLRHKGIHSFQLALWYPVIGGQKHERDIWFTSLHVRRSNITVHLRHVIVEKHQIDRMRDKRLPSLPFVAVRTSNPFSSSSILRPSSTFDESSTQRINGFPVMAYTPDSSGQCASTGKDLDLALFRSGGSVSNFEAPGCCRLWRGIS